MIEICEKIKCTACGACTNICPQKCISLVESEDGQLYPLIDIDKCIDCGKCKIICPQNAVKDFNYPKACYAAWITDVKERKKCASGGIGTALAYYYINEKKGVFFGTRYDNKFIPQVLPTDKFGDIEAYEGSKYVHSFVGNSIYNNVKKLLEEKKNVLFIGTPCQISGLKAVVGKNYDNLLTVDLICHGTCSYSYLRNEVNLLMQRKKIKKITNIRFRGNDNNNYKLTLWNGDKRVYTSRFNYYMHGYLNSVILRDNCYSCDYARPERISDITIGDFIGLGADVPFKYSTENVSVVMINTDKGKKAWSEFKKHNSNLRCIKREYEERLKYGPSLRYPVARTSESDCFKEKYIKYGYDKAIRCALRKYMVKMKILFLIRAPYKMILKIYEMVIK